MNGRVDVQLVDARSSTLLWTGATATHQGTPREDDLAPIIARIAGPFGAIAQAETARLTARTTGSYACLLRYFSHLKTRDAIEKKILFRCLDAPSDNVSLTSALTAVHAFAILEDKVWTDRTAQVALAEKFARQSLQENSEDAYAHYAMARIAYLESKCTAADYHAQRAIAANPYDAMIVTVIAGLSYQCGSPRAGTLLDRAYRIRNDNDVAMRGFLIFATISQGQEQRLKALGFASRPPPGAQLPGFLLTETLIAAAQGRQKEAATQWNEFKQLYPGAGPSDEDKLRPIVLSDPTRRLVLQLLRKNGVINS